MPASASSSGRNHPHRLRWDEHVQRPGRDEGRATRPSLAATRGTIDKNVDRRHDSRFVGRDATFDYTVDVSHGPAIDSGWKATGTINVFNPNTFAVNGVSVSDAVDDGGTCSISDPHTGLSIAAGTSVDLDYSCTYGSLHGRRNEHGDRELDGGPAPRDVGHGDRSGQLHRRQPRPRRQLRRRERSARPELAPHVLCRRPERSESLVRLLARVHRRSGRHMHGARQHGHVHDEHRQPSDSAARPSPCASART